MSRVSRRFHTTQCCITTNYQVGVYVRESAVKEDASESCENQLEMLKVFVKKQPDMALKKIYVDNGFSGTSFQRPDFQRLLADASKKEINCIVVKDFSRLGRNLVETGNYLECIFPAMQLRFISVNDHYDSLFAKADMNIPIKNLINELYARDISNKTKSVYKVKQQKGEYLGSIPPYGYLRNPENIHQLMVDEATAPVVKYIFRRRAEGMGYQAIAANLNEKGIFPPYRYFYTAGILKNKRYQHLSHWHHSAVARIVQNVVYLGHMAQGKYQSMFVEGMRHMKTPKENWITVENTHQAIVDEYLFLKAQKNGRR